MGEKLMRRTNKIHRKGSLSSSKNIKMDHQMLSILLISPPYFILPPPKKNKKVKNKSRMILRTLTKKMMRVGSE